ncbi:MAG: hypothetical protein AB8B47_11050 [Roseobacter sp.]
MQLWNAASQYLPWSDIPNKQIQRFDNTNGLIPVFLEPSKNCNGQLVDRQGRLITCEHLAWRATRAEPVGAITVSRIATRASG